LMLLLVIFAGFALLTLGLWRSQLRLEQRVTELEARNTHLTKQVVEQSSRQMQGSEGQQRIEFSEARLASLEHQISNATETAKALQHAANTQSPSRGPRSVRTVEGPVGSPEMALVPETPAASVPLKMSSSHTTEGQLQRRSWGPEQALGPPDTAEAGDIPTAWAPRDSTGSGQEWLHLNYDRAVEVSEINIRETHNPGAVAKVAAVLPDGREVVVWEGTEPQAQAPINLNVTVPQGVQAGSVRVYLDRTRVQGWNEIDAVELVARDGTRQWASSASASSSYAER